MKIADTRNRPATKGSLDLQGKNLQVHAMIMNHSTKLIRMCGLQALEALLTQTSAIQLKDAAFGGPSSSPEIDILAHIHVFSRSHTLACAVTADREPHHVRGALERLRNSAGRLPGEVTPVLVVPSLSAETRALCQESGSGFLDLEGNGHLEFGEVFVSVRSLPRHAVYEVFKAPARMVEGSLGKGVRDVLSAAP